MDTHLSFSLPRTAVRSQILIPKYYDPDLELAKERAGERYLLPQLGELLLPGDLGSRLGHWIGREVYGTGALPYVRTSDLSHWRIRPDYKKGVAEEIYEKYRDRQDVRVDDILMVAHGTYLVGNVAVVTEEDLKLVLQDHVFRLRINLQAGIHPYYILAALSTNFVRRQIRARQFSADIIDKVGERHLEVCVPVLHDQIRKNVIAAEVRGIIYDQTMAREQFRLITGSDLRMTRERAETRYGFSLSRSRVRSRILIPKYYDPTITSELMEMKQRDSAPWIALHDLVNEGLLSITTGVEVGKMAYGTGEIPFIRTSDIVDHQIKLDVRHGISERLYDAYKLKASVEPGDILVVRDGTYLVGSSAIVTHDDLPAIFCGGILRLRSLDLHQLSPYWLLTVLNLPIVRRQMRARQFTRDVIDTLGDRILEVEIPNPTIPGARDLANKMASIVSTLQEVKTRIQAVVSEIERCSPANTLRKERSQPYDWV
jgi:hypothetical protein